MTHDAGSMAVEILDAVQRIREELRVARERTHGRLQLLSRGSPETDLEPVATLPPLYPEWLGDRSFGEVHGVRFPYVVGEMANGLTTARMVVAVTRRNSSIGVVSLAI